MSEVKEVEEIEDFEIAYNHTDAPYPANAIECELKHWLRVVAESEDFSDDLKDEINDIPAFHYKALMARIHTVLMEHGVFEDTDGRLKHNKKKK